MSACRYELLPDFVQWAAAQMMHPEREQAEGKKCASIQVIKQSKPTQMAHFHSISKSVLWFVTHV